jgi:hypothetical protein
MELHELNPETLEIIRRGMCRDDRHGVLLMHDEGRITFFTCPIAPDHWLYVEVTYEYAGISVGVLHRPKEHIARMLRSAYRGCRIQTDALGLVGKEGELVAPLSDEDETAYQQAAEAYFRRDIGGRSQLNSSPANGPQPDAEA